MHERPASIIRRRLFAVGAMASAWLPLARIAGAQSAASVRRVGVLFSDQTDAKMPDWSAFVEELGRRGWVEGRSIVFERRFAAGQFRPDRLDALAIELAALDVDVIYVRTGTGGALAAKRATTTIPIVFKSSGDPVGFGLVESLRRPGGNLTGSSILVFDIDPKAMQILAEATGKLTRFAYIQPSAIRSASWFPAWVASMTATAERLGAKAEFVDLDSDGDIVATLKRLVRQGFDGAMCDNTGHFKLNASQVAALFVENRMPTIGDARAGFLLHYNVHWSSVAQTTAAYVDRILRGAKPSDLPIQQASKFELVINLKTARALGLTIPQSVLARADELIQ